MAPPLYLEFEHILRKIYKADLENITHLVKSVNNNVVKALIEIAYNILKGDIPISPKQIIKLKKDKAFLHLLISRTVPVKKKRDILEKNQSLIKNMLAVLFRSVK